MSAGTMIAPHVIQITESAQDAGWPLTRVIGEAADRVMIDDLEVRFPRLKPHASLPPGTLPPTRALLLPLPSIRERPHAILILALSPHRPFDEDYTSFVDLVGQQINSGLGEARAKQIERERLDRLAELDRAKTEFFSNVSHEFCTPLTLLLAPLEDLVHQRDSLPPRMANEVEVAARNARRLLRLVNSLLDFSAIDARRQGTSVEVTDLGALTADIVSTFRSAVEAASLRLEVEIDPDLPLVPVNREMWEKIVSNLLSNAFKILVVDDNADIRDYLRRLLNSRWEVQLAADGEEALATIRNGRPDLLLADVMMPGVDGFELLRHIRADETLKTLPIILLSARAGEEAKVEGFDAGADDYLVKPFTARELLARVQAHLRLARIRRRAAQELSARLADLEKANAAIRDTRLATLNILEDTIEARNRAEQLYRELRERETWLAGQSKALEVALNGAPLETSLGILVQTTIEQSCEGTRAAFYLADADGISLHHVVGMPANYARAVDGFRIGPESLACGLATHTGQSVLTTDVREDPLWEPWRWLAEQFDYRGCWSFPIHTTAGKFVGTFAVYSRQPRATTSHDLEFAAHLTQVAAILISQYTETQIRIHTEAALHESEQRFRSLGEH